MNDGVTGSAEPESSEMRSGPASPAASGELVGQTKRWWWWLLAIVVFGCGLRFWALDRPSFWVDELFTVRHSATLFQKMPISPRFASYVPTVLGMYATGVDLGALDPDDISTWRSAGVEEWKARLVPAMIGCLALLLLPWTARSLIGPRAALILALLLAISPWHLWMSQAARFYAAQFLFFNLAMIWFVRSQFERSRLPLIGAVLAFSLAFLSQVTSLMLVAIIVSDYVVSLILRDPRRFSLRSVIVTVAISALCGLAIYRTIIGFLSGKIVFHGSPQSTLVLVLGTAFMVGLPVVALVGATLLWMVRQPAERRVALLLLAGFVVPLAAFVVLGWLGWDVHIRYTFVALFSWLALAAVGLDRLISVARPVVGRCLSLAPLGMVAAAMLFGVFAYFTAGHGNRARWRDAMAYIKANRSPGEVVAGDFIARMMAEFYLEDPDVVEVRLGPLDAKAPGVMGRRHVMHYRELDRPAWLVFRASEPAAGKRGKQVDRYADLRAYFGTHVVQPHHLVHVYSYPKSR